MLKDEKLNYTEIYAYAYIYIYIYIYREREREREREKEREKLEECMWICVGVYVGGCLICP